MPYTRAYEGLITQTVIYAPLLEWMATMEPKGYSRVTAAKSCYIDDGARVIVNDNYVSDNESNRKYFVCELSTGYCLLADNKKELNEGRGYIHSISHIDFYKNF